MNTTTPSFYIARVRVGGSLWRTPARRTLEEAIGELRLKLRPHMDKHWREITDAKVEVVLCWPSGKWEVVTLESLRRN